MVEMSSRHMKAVIGLGNPGAHHYYQRHSIGFRILDDLAQRYHGDWREQGQMAYAEIFGADNNKIILVKPLTYMNSSGAVMAWLHKKGIGAEDCVVVHDELELPFGTIKWRIGGSHRGHNGVRSIIAHGGELCARLRIGIGRPDIKEQVPDYVLAPFNQTEQEVRAMINNAVNMMVEKI